MNWLINNWFLIVAAIAVIIFAVIAIVKFFKQPKEQLIKNVKEWLKWAVVKAEKELGEKTGQLKLRLVYDWALAKFPWLAELITFDTFSDWVDEALKWMEKELTNPAAQNYISSK